jgi:hypothetical protein
MILIAHRGNIQKKSNLENHPDYLETSLKIGYDVELDVRKIGNKWYLGHDEPQYEVNRSFFDIKGLWIHAKNGDAYYELLKDENLNVFWHDTDDYVLTSKKLMWVYPNKFLYENSICVLPELGYNGDIKKCYGICSDFIINYETL